MYDARAHKILLVEDDPATAMYEASAVQNHGFEVTTVYRGQQAVDRIQGDPEIGLVLMDIELGKGMDGAQTAEAILRSHEIPIVFLTAYSNERTVHKVQGIPSYGYILKNTGEQVLIQTIEAALRLFEKHKKMRDRNEFYTLFQRNPVSLFLIDRELQIHRLNAPAQEFTGELAEKAAGERIGEALRCRNRRHSSVGCGKGPFCSNCDLRTTITNTFENGGNRTHKEIHLPRIHPKGYEETYFLGSASCIDTEEGILALLALEDITERKRTEQLLQKNEKIMEKAEELTGVGAWMRDVENDEIVLSSGAQRLLGISKRRVSYEEMESRVHPDDRPQVNSAIEEAIAHGGNGCLEHKIIRGDDRSVRTIRAQAVPVRNEEHRVIRIYGALHDITEEKELEEQKKHLLEEKDTLIAEVHHRIKNHMSTIFSILSLQASKFRDKEVIDAFEEAKTRIRLMQSIYQKLYTGSDAHSIKISDYLRELLSDIEKTYSLSGTVRINAEIEDCIVSAKQSLPIGIVVNELVSNSLKYAFSPFNEGSIEVVVRKSDLSYLEVIVSDDGSGLPREVVEEGEYGFGLTLVEGYAIQYEGELSIENSPAGGSRIRVSMELEGL